MSNVNALLTDYTIIDVILIIFLVAFVLKEGMQLFDFFKTRFKKGVAKEESLEDIVDKLNEIEGQITVVHEDTFEEFQKINERLDKHDSTLKQLVESDRDDIKADIVKQYHYFMQKGEIDDFSMDTLEKRYSHYVEEGGNSYVSTLMTEIRKLKKIGAC